MKGDAIETFMTLAGQKTNTDLEQSSPELKKLGAQLLLSEVLEYVIKGLGVTPVVNGQKIEKPDALDYLCDDNSAINKTEALDGLCDTAYTMYWNMYAFGFQLEDAFKAVCDNNLEKFVLLENWHGTQGSLAKDQWSLGSDISWPVEVEDVSVVKVKESYYAVGKDGRGKVRKPSTYKSVNLSAFL